MKIRASGTEQEITDLVNDLYNNPWGYAVEEISKHYPNRDGSWRVYFEMGGRHCHCPGREHFPECPLAPKVPVSDHDGLVAGDKVDVCTNRGGWRGKGIFVRYEGDLSVVKRHGKEESYNKDRVRYTLFQ